MIKSEKNSWAPIRLEITAETRDGYNVSRKFTATIRIPLVTGGREITFNEPYNAYDPGFQAGQRLERCTFRFYDGTRFKEVTTPATLRPTLVAKDEGCFRDLLAITKEEGVTQRKHLAELMNYRCAEEMDAKTAVQIIRRGSTRNKSGELVPFVEISASGVSGLVSPAAISMQKLVVKEQLDYSQDSK